MSMAKQRVIDLWMMVLQVFLDAATFYFCFYFSFLIRFHSGFLPVYRGLPAIDLYLENFPIATIVLILVFKSFGLYDKKGLGAGISPFKLFQAVTIGVFVLMSITFVYRDVTFSRAFFFVAWILATMMIILSRFLFRRFEKWLYQKAGIQKKVLLIGNGELLTTMVQNIERNSDVVYDLAGILGDEIKEPNQSFKGKPVPILGKIDQLSDVLSGDKIDEVILAIPDLEQKRIVEIILTCEKELVRFRMVPNIFEILTSQVEVDYFNGVTLLGLKQFPLEKTLNRILKRSMDIFGSLFGLIALLPLFAFISVLIKHNSKGHVFYRQERVGEDGQTFTIVKFRTMIENAEAKTGPVWASEGDSRRTSLGETLRQFNLDELPQLWNVLKGEMSLVGPRPERPHFVNEFKDRIPRYMSRHRIKSGMTGWAQVNGLRGNTSIVDRIKYDLYYLENWSLMLDLKIILKTFLTRKNAY